MKILPSFSDPCECLFYCCPLVCVVLGAATAFYAEGAFHLKWFLIAITGGLCAHISVNALNEYEDFNSRLDYRTTRTPFSGGSGTLPDHPGKAHWAAAIGVVTLALTLLVGVYFLWVWGPGLLLIGIPGVLVVVLYTRWLTHDPLLCLLAPGIGFGPCMVMGADFVLTGTYSAAAVAASISLLFSGEQPVVDQPISGYRAGCKRGTSPPDHRLRKTRGCDRLRSIPIGSLLVGRDRLACGDGFLRRRSPPLLPRHWRRTRLRA
jgi:4-hydroxybenzoate polyprenyltransferase